MKASGLADHFLRRLYELAEEAGYSKMHSLNELAGEIGIQDRGKIFNVAKSLEARGLIQAAHTFGGSQACITGEGALLVETAIGRSPSSEPATYLSEEEGPREQQDLRDAWESLLHPAIRASALSQYRDGHWRDAVLNAFIAVFDLVRSRTGLDLDGDRLATRVFSADNPLLVVADLSTESGRNDQVGLMMVLQGVYRGIRSPKAHSLQHDLNALKAAQYLVMASLLARRVDEAESPVHGSAA